MRVAAQTTSGILIAGFGGLLFLMAFAEVDGVRALGQIQTSGDRIREAYQHRTRALERIRSGLYVSGTYVRDYLLEPESGKAEGHRYSLLETRADMESAVAEYRALVDASGAPTFEALTRDLGEYWKVLEPTFQWNAEQRKQGGYAFLRDEVFPRRTAMLRIADQADAINESQLNAGKIEMAGTFSQYRRRLTVTIGLTIGLGLLLATFSVRRILRLEAVAAEHYREISKARAEMQRLSARLVAAQEDERRSISRELHDEVGQSLTGMRLEMANLSTMMRAGDAGAAAVKAEEIKQMVEDSLGVVRNMALLLRPSMLDDLGLIPALEWQAREVSKRSGVRVHVEADRVSEDLPEEHKTCIYRVVQEALHNCTRHAGARSATVTVRQSADELSLTVVDAGKGFDARRKRGLGLIGIEERVANLGGSFSVESTPGRGARLRISLPLKETV